MARPPDVPDAETLALRGRQACDVPPGCRANWFTGFELFLGDLLGRVAVLPFGRIESPVVAEQQRVVVGADGVAGPKWSYRPSHPGLMLLPQAVP